MNDEEERERLDLRQGSDMRPTAADCLDLPRLAYSRHGKDCFPASLAAAFDLDLETLPDEPEAPDPHWFDVYRSFLFSRGLLAQFVKDPPFYVSVLEIPGHEHGHAIVGRDGRRVFDPVRELDPVKVRARAHWAELARLYCVPTPPLVEAVVRIAYALANRLGKHDGKAAAAALGELDKLTGNKR